MKDEQTILTEFLDAIRGDLVVSMEAKNRKASGRTISEITPEVNGEHAVLTAPAYIDFLEYGRPPTSDGAAKGDPTLFDRIVQWISDKGLDLNPYAVTKHIHKYGYPGKPGVITEPLGDDNLDKRLANAMDQLADNQVEEIMDVFNLI